MTMQLIVSPTSPYARKAWITAIEGGLMSELTTREMNPMQDDAIRDINPFGKVPALKRDGADDLFDSHLICAYFDHLAGGRFTPSDPEARLTDLRRHLLATGVCDAAVARRMESARPDGERSPSWMERWLQSMKRGVAELERMGAPDTRFSNLGSIATACVLGYLDLRYADLMIWRESNPALADWYAEIELRPSFIDTKPA